MREQLLHADRTLRDKQLLIQSLEFNLSHQTPALQDELHWSEQERAANAY